MGQNLPKTSKREVNPSAILQTMYEDGNKYSSIGIETSVQ